MPSTSFIRNIRYLYSSWSSISGFSRAVQDINEVVLSPIYFSIDISKEETLVPSRYSYELSLFSSQRYVPSPIKKNYKDKDLKRLIIPIPNLFTPSMQVASFDTFLRRLNSSSFRSIGKGNDMYYAGDGLIFDTNYNPIVVSYIKKETQSMEDLCPPLLRISKNIFINNTKFVEKNLIKTVIPYIINTYGSDRVEFVDTFDDIIRIPKVLPTEEINVKDVINKNIELLANSIYE